MMEIKNFDEFVQWVSQKQRVIDELKEDNYNLERERLKETEHVAELQEQIHERDIMLDQVNGLVNKYYSPMGDTIVPEKLDEVTLKLLSIREAYVNLKTKPLKGGEADG